MDYKVRVCPRCGEQYQPLSRHQKCCVDCRKRKSVSMQKVCVRCGTTYLSTGNSQKHCLDCALALEREEKDAWGSKNPKYFSTWYEKGDNSEKVKATASAWNKDHLPRRKEIARQSRKCHPETTVVISRRSKAKRRLLGFNPLNSPFLGCEGHHINKDDVIYMPIALHHSIWHNQYTGRGMAEMNALAGQYLMENWT